MAIAKTSLETKEAIRRKSAQGLPNNPSARGMSAEQIKKAFYAPITETSDSILTEQDRIVDEANAEFADLQAAYREEVAAALENALDAINGKLDKVPAQEGKQYTVAAVDKDGNPTSLAVDVGGYGFAIPLRETGGRLRVPDPTTDSHAINRGYLNKMCGTHDPRLTALETAVAGRARSYVLPDMAALADALCGRWELGEKTYYADALLTGDNLLIIEQNVPDFWFEATTDRNRAADTYTYTDADGGEVTLSLRVFGYDNGGGQVGLLHVLESDYTVIEGYSKSASRAAEEAAASASEAREVLGSVGELDAALDAILDLQASLIGGAT